MEAIKLHPVVQKFYDTVGYMATDRLVADFPLPDGSTVKRSTAAMKVEIIEGYLSKIDHQERIVLLKGLVAQCDYCISNYRVQMKGFSLQESKIWNDGINLEMAVKSWCNQMIEFLEANTVEDSVVVSPVKWNIEKYGCIDFIELVTALLKSGAITVDLPNEQQRVEAIGKLFGVSDLKDVHRKRQKIKNRNSGNEAKFIDHLKISLLESLNLNA